MSKLTRVTSVEDFRQLAKRRVPRIFYDYVDSGSWSETTYRTNTIDLEKLTFHQRVAIDVEEQNLRTSMVGEDVSMPIAIAPTGSAGMQYADGEILEAKAAEKFGVPFILSTVSICSIEDVAAYTERPFWFQLYFTRDRSFNERLIHRASKAGCSTLVVTLDAQVPSQRLKDVKNGLSIPLRPTVSSLVNIATKPRWCWRMLKTNRRTFGNIVGHAKGVDSVASLSSWINEQLDSSLDWRDIDWIRGHWDGKLVLKGITDPDDARKAISCGADALVVSNHGGRQLDGAPSSISSLPAIINNTENSIEIWLDSGIWSGQDVLRAVGMGAKGTLIGRPFLYALGAAGQAGIEHYLSILRDELSKTMKYCGYTDINKVDHHVLTNPDLFQ